jgi:uncharacterized protein (TIGR02246 family)
MTKRWFKLALIAVSAATLPFLAGQASATTIRRCGLSAAIMTKDASNIRQTLSSYNTALNAGKTALVLPLYTEDGVFMSPYSSSAIGKADVAQAYDAVFAELKFHVKFSIQELVVLAPDWAYVRTSSAGTTDHHSTGHSSAEANQELFIFNRGNDGVWRIARYSFSPTNPPHH